MTRQRRRSDVGAVTAEFAMALPAVVLALAVVLWGLAAAGASMRCADAARAGARAGARGETPAAVGAAAARLAPGGATVRSSAAGGLVTVTVQARIAAPGRLLSRLPGLAVSGRAVADVEVVGP